MTSSSAKRSASKITFSTYVFHLVKHAQHKQFMALQAHAVSQLVEQEKNH